MRGRRARTRWTRARAVRPVRVRQTVRTLSRDGQRSRGPRTDRFGATRSAARAPRASRAIERADGERDRQLPTSRRGRAVLRPRRGGRATARPRSTPGWSRSRGAMRSRRAIRPRERPRSRGVAGPCPREAGDQCSAGGGEREHDQRQQPGEVAVALRRDRGIGLVAVADQVAPLVHQQRAGGEKSPCTQRESAAHRPLSIAAHQGSSVTGYRCGAAGWASPPGSPASRPGNRSDRPSVRLAPHATRS